MAGIEISTRRIAISKANAQMVIFVAVACFLTVFSLVAAKSVLSENEYLQRVIDKKNVANKQLKQNISAYSSLSSTYNSFVSAPTNIIGGNSGGSGQSDGDNAKIVLDSLPSTYDYPALASIIENILTQQNLQIGSITGTDNALTQQTGTTSSNPQPVPMPITFSVQDTNYIAVEQLITRLQQSIRPISIDTLQLAQGSSSQMTATITAHSYFQAAKGVQIESETVK